MKLETACKRRASISEHRRQWQPIGSLHRELRRCCLHAKALGDICTWPRDDSRWPEIRGSRRASTGPGLESAAPELDTILKSRHGSRTEVVARPVRSDKWE